MKKNALLWFKEALTRLGARTSEQWIHHLQMVVNYMKLGKWMARQGFGVPAERVRSRTEVFDAVAARVRDRETLYLEFGVYKGASMRYWSDALKNPKAQLHGFDSFEGLPEDFDIGGPYVKGTFDVGGSPPDIDDPRVTFHKGWFEETVPHFVPGPHEVLVVCLDADLYSSTKLVLEHLKPWIKPGTFLYFDDLSRPDHEPRAFEEFMGESMLRFRLVVADRSEYGVLRVCRLS